MKYSFIFLVAIFLIFMYGCDTFEEDSIAPENGVELSSDNIHVLANSSSVIDFNRIVKAQQTVSVKITDEPEKGVFGSVENNLFSYKPNEGFLEGTDAVGFDVMDTDEQVIVSGTIDIVVSQDTESFPCELFAIEDNAVLPPNSQRLTIDVLANDILCEAAPSDVQLSIVKYSGGGDEAGVQDQKIEFFPRSGFEMASMIYKINPVDEPDAGAYGIINIVSGPAPCQFNAVDDIYNYQLPFDGWGGWIDVEVLSNDQLCLDGSTLDVFRIVQFPQSGELTIDQNKGVLSYHANNIHQQEPYTDTAIYEVCKDQDCDRATVTFNFTASQSSDLVQGVDDAYTFDVGSVATQTISVMDNDVFQNLSNADIAIVEHAKNGESRTDDKLVWYTYTPSSQAVTDQITYRICETIDGVQFCDEAVVNITISQSSGLVQGVDDAYTFDVGSVATQTISVMDNDVFQNLSNADIEIVEHAKNGESRTGDKLVWYTYTPGSQAVTDQITYRICETIDGVQFCDEAVVNITIK